MILYTSGTTGEPKGAILRHRGFIETLSPCRENLGAYALRMYGHTLLGIASHTFSFFCIEYCMVLSTACTYVMADAGQSRNPVLMAELIRQHRVDAVALTPSVLLQFLKVPAYTQALKNVRIVGIGGEAPPSDIAEKIRRYAPACHIFNLYSQTESNGTLLSEEILDRPGHAFPNRGWKLFIADDKGRGTRDGEAGELLMAGGSMMLGYHNHPDEMAAKTVVIDGVTYFRTGDYVRRNADGSYAVIGRADRMIKLRGLRIEPGEIEKHMRDFPGVRIDEAAAASETFWSGYGMPFPTSLRAFAAWKVCGIRFRIRKRGSAQRILSLSAGPLRQKTRRRSSSPMTSEPPTGSLTSGSIRRKP